MVELTTHESEAIATNWRATANPLQRASITCSRVFNATPEVFFKLLCPTTEYDWLPDWRCTLLHSESGYAEYNAAFTTQLFGSEELWVCTRYEPNIAVDYSRTSRHACSKMDIRVMDNGNGTVTGTWVLSTSALDEDGNPVVARLSDLRSQMEDVFDALEHYLNTGERKPRGGQLRAASS